MTEEAGKETRMTFIPALREKVTESLIRSGVSRLQIDHAFRLWDEGAEPSSPIDHGCFAVFRQVQADVNKVGE